MKNKHTLGIITALIADVIFGFSFMASKVAMEYCEPTVLLVTRFTLAAVAMTVVVIISPILQKKGKCAPFVCHFRGKPVWKLVVLGVIHPAAYCLLENYGILNTSSAVAGTILAVVPVFCILLDVLVLHTRVTLRQILCAVFAVGGVALISAGGAVKTTALGLLFLILTMITDGMFYFLSNRNSQYFSAFEITYGMFVVAAIVMIPIVAVQYAGRYELLLPAFTSTRYWLAAGYLGLVSSLLGYGLLNFASSKLTVSETSLFSNVITVVSILAGVFLLGEPFGLWQILGVAVISVCVYLANVAPSRGKKET